MKAIVAPQPGGAEELALVERPVPRAGAGRSAGQGRGGGGQPARHPPAPRALSAAARRARHPRPRNRRRGGRRRARAPRRWSGSGSARWSRAAAMPNIASRRPAPACRCPKCLPMAEAAAMPETLFTVWVNLFERGFAADGDVVLVHGGTSGIGTMAIALGKLFGLHGDRHLRQRREMRRARWNSARRRRSITGARISSRRCSG